VSAITLIPATDRLFGWMLGEPGEPTGLTLPPAGIDQDWVLRWLRRTLPTLGGRGSWLMIDAGEVVGMISYKRPPDGEGVAEIGYGVAPERRRRGHATRAVSLMLEAAREDARIKALTAETALANVGSQRVLITNGFSDVGRSHDDDEGETIVWRLALC
jgi:RimJ/RimL family protein N-acetyltransferase